MSEHLFKLLAAYAAGTAATAVFVRLVWLMPIEDIVKHILAWILPLPVILIVLVLSYYGPQAPVEAAVLPDSPAALLRIFIFGTLSVFAVYALAPVTRFIVNLLMGNRHNDEENDAGE